MIARLAVIVGLVLLVAGLFASVLDATVESPKTVAEDAVIRYAQLLSSAFDSVASSVEAGELSDQEANDRLAELTAAARHDAFAPINEELQRAVKDGQWDKQEAAKIMRRLSDGFARVK